MKKCAHGIKMIPTMQASCNKNPTKTGFLDILLASIYMVCIIMNKAGTETLTREAFFVVADKKPCIVIAKDEQEIISAGCDITFAASLAELKEICQAMEKAVAMPTGELFEVIGRQQA